MQIILALVILFTAEGLGSHVHIVPEGMTCTQELHAIYQEFPEAFPIFADCLEITIETGEI
jgi:hypothetical protein